MAERQLPKLIMRVRSPSPAREPRLRCERCRRRMFSGASLDTRVPFRLWPAGGSARSSNASAGTCGRSLPTPSATTVASTASPVSRASPTRSWRPTTHATRRDGSSGPRQDVDLLLRGDGHVTVSLSTLDGNAAARLEPGAPTPAERLEVVHELADAGVPVWVSVTPWVPGVTDITSVAHSVGSTIPIRVAPLNVNSPR
jgi:hypothetical protein